MVDWATFGVMLLLKPRPEFLLRDFGVVLFVLAQSNARCGISNVFVVRCLQNGRGRSENVNKGNSSPVQYCTVLNYCTIQEN
jgi:hypothetical protein